MHAQQLEREREVRRLRLESHAQAAREKACKLTLQLRQAEVDIATAKGREEAGPRHGFEPRKKRCVDSVSRKRRKLCVFDLRLIWRVA